MVKTSKWPKMRCVMLLLRWRDVPGASLPLSLISANSVPSLKRYLKCRGVKSAKKRKQELVKLVEQCIEENRPILQTIDRGVWLTQKMKTQRSVELNSAAQNPTTTLDVFPVTGWKLFPSQPVPSAYCYGHIYKYIILTASVQKNTVQVVDSDSDREDEIILTYDTEKPLKKGRRYFLSGHVVGMMDCLSNSKHYCVKSQVHASMNDVKYAVCVMLHSETAEVLDANCNCKASAMGRCSHVAALLFALEDYSDVADPVSCTSQLCTWNQGKKKKASVAIYVNKYSGKRDPTRAIGFQPLNMETNTEHPQHEPLRVCQEHTQACQRKAGGFGNIEPTMWELLLEFKYDNYDLEESHLDYLICAINQLRDCLLFGFQGKSGTVKQTQSAEWKSIRTLLITASVAPRFLSARPESIYNLLRDHMWFPKSFCTSATEYGMKNEPEGRNAYMTATGNSVHDCGLWVNPDYPGLGASPDGLVHCRRTNSFGLLEIKCPFVLKNLKPEEFLTLNKSQVSNFCLKNVGDSMFLKRSHKYYLQVQMQIAVVGVQWCDFVVWSPKGIFVERIHFDNGFWEPVSRKLLEFHACYLCPEYFEMRIPRKLPPMKIPNNYVM